MANITATTLANFVPELWSMDTLDAVEFAMMITKLVCRDYEGEIASKGDTVHIPHTNNYSTASKAAGVAVTFEALTHGVTDISINQHKYSAFQEEKFADKQALPGYREKQTKKLGYAIARQLEVDVAALFASLTSSDVGTLGVELTDSKYREAWTKLATAGAIREGTMNEDVNLILSAEAYAAALGTEKFVNRDYGAGDAVSSARVGTIYGSQAYMSNLLNSPSAGQHNCAWIHRDALCCAVQQKPTTESDFIIEQLAWAVVVHIIYGTAVLTRPVETPGSVSTTNNFGVRLRTV